MEYLVMLSIVVGLAVVDVITGLIKAHVKDDYSSRVMRKGGLNKVSEILIMATACGLEIGINKLGDYYDKERFAASLGTFAALSVLVYIVVMEVISILENFAESNEKAAIWINPILKKLRKYNELINNDKEE